MVSVFQETWNEGEAAMAEFIKLPVGIENFEKIRRDGFYYVDKTGLIEQLLNNWGEVNLFTRPRRFGKTLNMSMLKCFFEIGTDQSLFDGLYISKNKALCDAYMGKYPVISISLKGVNADSYENARSLLKRIVMEEAKMHRIIMSGNRLDDIPRAINICISKAVSVIPLFYCLIMCILTIIMKHFFHFIIDKSKRLIILLIKD